MTIPAATPDSQHELDGDGNDAMEVNDEVDEREDVGLPSLCIPITSSATAAANGLFVEIFPEEISTTSSATLMEVLRDESADIKVWADASLLYMQHKFPKESLAFLEEANQSVVTTDKEKKVHLLAANGIAYLALSQHNHQSGSSSSSKRLGAGGGAGGGGTEREDADRLFTQASKVDTFFPMTWIGRGMLNLISGRFDQSKFFFQTTLKQCGPVLPALLGMAAVLFGEGDYKAAQGMYAEVIRKFPMKSGAPARVGFGLACYRLGQMDRAKAAFQRALALDSECVEAMIGVALLGMSGVNESSFNFSVETEKAVKLLSMANLIDHSNSMVQNHLANHYFWKWTPVTGTIEVTKGSKVVKCSQPMPLDPHERIRIGTNFETTVMEDANALDEDSTTFTIQEAWKEESVGGLKAWKKDYDRVVALAKGAYGSTSVAHIQAESLFFLARVYHVREEIENSHKFYERACKLAPDLLPAKFGLAQTLVVKDDYNAAMEHLNQIITNSTMATDALSLLGLLEVRSGKKVEEGLAHIRKAIDLDPLNPQLLITEALALQQQRPSYGDALERYKKAIDLMKRHTKQKVPYDVYVNCGVLCHETRKYEEAMTMYKMALEALDPDGLQSVPTLDNIGMDGGLIRQDENDMFCGFVDSELCVQLVMDGTNVHWKVIQNVTNDSILNIRAGDRVRIAKTFITNVVSILNEKEALTLVVSDEFQVGMNSDENSSFLSIFVVRENRMLDVPEIITIAFNIARLHEVCGRIMSAIELHKAILKRNPCYVNSSLRLACIAVDCGTLNECGEWLKISAATSPGNPEVLTLIGNLHLSLCDWAAAQSVFERLLVKKVPNVEAYASLSLGNIYFANLHVSEKRYGKHLQYASDFYRNIMIKDTSNAYAANGIGTILAEKGEIFKAKEVFNRVREVSNDTIADALLNLGHIYLAQKKNSEALQLYQQYLERIEDSNTPVTSKSRVDDIVDVLLFIAFAYFDWARHKELLNNTGAAAADALYRKAIEHLINGIDKHSKKATVLKYNLAMTKLQAANCVLQKLTRNIVRTVEEVQEALDELEESRDVVKQILEDKTRNKKIAIPFSILHNFLSHCQANIISAKSHLEDEKQRAAEAETEQEIRRLAMEAEMKEAEIEEAIRKEHQAKEVEERDRKAEAMMQKVAVLRDNWHKEQLAEKTEKDKKKKNNEIADFIQEDPLQDEGVGHGLFDDSDESDDERKSQSEELEKKHINSDQPVEQFGDSDSDGDNNDSARESTKSAKKTSLSSKTDLFGESDFESDNNSNRQTTKDTNIFRSSDEESDEELLLGATNDQTALSNKRKNGYQNNLNLLERKSGQSMFSSDDDDSDKVNVDSRRDRKKPRMFAEI